MTNKLFLTFLVLFSMKTAAFSQQTTAKWDNWDWLLGKWHGEGTGRPGTGGGDFSFAFDLDNKIIVRKAHSEYPAEGNKPKIVHADLLIVYLGEKGNPDKAIYFDNAGQSIQYTITYSEKNIVFNSGKVEGRPFFRLTYTLLDKDFINTKFEISQDGNNFSTYIEGKSKKIN